MVLLQPMEIISLISVNLGSGTYAGILRAIKGVVSIKCQNAFTNLGFTPLSLASGLICGCW